MIDKIVTPVIDHPAELFQKPPEVFAGLVPIGRRLFTRRLYLRRFRQSDAHELFELYKKNRSYLCRWLQPQPETLRIANMINLIREDHRSANKGDRLDLGIFDGETDLLVGRIALHSVDYGIQRSAGISYWISEDSSSRGFATEALSAIVSFAFEEACLHRLWLNIIEENKASKAIAVKLGFRKEGSFKQNLFINGKWRDSLIFAMLENEYDELADQWISKQWLGF